MIEKILQTGKSIRHILLGLQNTRTFLKVDLKCNTSKVCKMELQEENTIQSQDKMQIKEFHHTRSYTQSQNLARLLIIVLCVQSVTSNSLLNKVVLDL